MFAWLGELKYIILFLSSYVLIAKYTKYDKKHIIRDWGTATIMLLGYMISAPTLEILDTLDIILCDVRLSFLVPVVLMALTFVINNKNINILLTAMVMCVGMIIPIGNLLYYPTNKVKIYDSDIFLAVLQTNDTEAFEFISDNVMLLIMVVSSIVVLVVLVYIINSKIYLNYKCGRRQKILMVLIMIASIILGNKFVSHGQVASNYKVARDFVNQTLYRQPPKDLVVTADEDKKNVIIVIGESSTRDYYSVYGFPYQTTPWMDAVKNSDNYIFFNNAYSCEKMTAKCLAMALSEYNQYEAKKLEECADIADVLKAAGYNMYWYSTQAFKEELHVYYSYIAGRCDKHIYLSHNNSTEKDNLDDKLIEVMPRLSDKGNVVFLHILGSHTPYELRVPDEFKSSMYSQDQKVNDYLNTVKFTDYVLEGIQKKASTDMNVDIILYFSDHGDKIGMTRERFDFQMTRIPFMVWMSDEYMMKNQARVNALKANREKYFSNDLIYDSFLGMMGINTNHYTERYDISNFCYDRTHDNVLTLYGQYHVKDDPYSN